MDRFYLYVFIMALTTYLIRVLPFVLFKREIRGAFMTSFLYYVPYVCLAAMTFPAILTAPGNAAVGGIAFVCALIAAFSGIPIPAVAVLASAAAYVAELFLLGGG
ncbi:MAG: AzlD domain-containing protein [Lachnospiraceae bacterium]|nr:AzlD domain-containing protein [Lachnospiraceae bacterium]